MNQEPSILQRVNPQSSHEQGPPLPPKLSYLTRAAAPLHVGTAEVRALVEFWGFTRNGEEFVKKLVRCGVLRPERFAHQRGNRYKTAEVLQLYETERA